MIKVDIFFTVFRNKKCSAVRNDFDLKYFIEKMIDISEVFRGLKKKYIVCKSGNHIDRVFVNREATHTSFEWNKQQHHLLNCSLEIHLTIKTKKFSGDCQVWTRWKIIERKKNYLINWTAKNTKHNKQKKKIDDLIDQYVLSVFLQDLLNDGISWLAYESIPKYFCLFFMLGILIIHERKESAKKKMIILLRRMILPGFFTSTTIVPAVSIDWRFFLSFSSLSFPFPVSLALSLFQPAKMQISLLYSNIYRKTL